MLEKGPREPQEPHQMEAGGFSIPHSSQIDIIPDSGEFPPVDPQYGGPDTDLYNADKVGWIRHAIGLDSGRHPDEISDAELMHRWFHGGRFEWDPAVSRQVGQYLKSRGFRWTL